MCPATPLGTASAINCVKGRYIEGEEDRYRDCSGVGNLGRCVGVVGNVGCIYRGEREIGCEILEGRTVRDLSQGGARYCKD